jgi:hypothetical protein
MTTITSYLFQGSNIGSDGLLKDAQNIPEMMYLIVKKNFGLANTIPDRLYSSETVPNIRNAIPNSFPFIHQTKLYSQYVPLSNPMVSQVQGLNNNNYIDYSFSNTNKLFWGNQTLVEFQSSKYINCNYPYICYYSNLLLTNVINESVATIYSNFNTSYGHPLLINAIPEFYDLTYRPYLFYSNTGARIISRDGYWLLDPDAGIVTFYDSNTGGSQVNSNNPPRISFFRYEGLFGEANILSGQDF